MNLGNIRSTILHLRLPFSLLLLPVYLFALSQVPNSNTFNAIVVFIILHLFTYPASNAYNSYFDKDEKSIALLKKPPKVDKSLYVTSIVLEWLGVLLAFIVSFNFALCVAVYNTISKAYSHPKIRLKKYPIISFLVVFIFQGCFIYFASYYAINDFRESFTMDTFIAGLICSCLIGASYPLTQIYQHEEDTKRGDKTLSILLGIKGSFLFSGIIFFSGLSLMLLYWLRKQQLEPFWVFLAFTFPILIYFVWWFLKCIQSSDNANFRNAMRMTLISGSCMLVYFSWICFYS